MKTTLLLLAFTFLGCSDTHRESYKAQIKRAEVKCYSGDTLAFHGLSESEIIKDRNRESYFGRWRVLYVEGEWKQIDQTKSLFARINGNCNIIYLD